MKMISDDKGTFLDSDNYGTISELNSFKLSIDKSNFQIKKSNNNHIKLILFLVIISILSFTIINNSSIIKYSAKSTSSIDISNVSLNRVGYDVISHFSNPTSYLRYKFLENYNAVIEPYVPMELYIESDELKSSKFYYKYSLCLSDDILQCYQGLFYPSDKSKSTSITIGCTSYSSYDFSIDQYSADSYSLLSSFEGTALCMYVRREIRTLTDDDLQSFNFALFSAMDAMHTLWEYDEVEGKKLYGEDYLSADNLAELHYIQAAWRDADHAHEGLGFLSQHIKMTNFFEQSVQLVDPSFSLPYWDYTIEPALGIDISDSPMFQASTFGSISPPRNWKYSEHTVMDAIISDGRWANLKSEINTKFTDLYSTYGYMRAPWSCNPTPYITRFTVNFTLPTCEYIYEGLKFDILHEYITNVRLDPHGTAHLTPGGIFGCDALQPLIDAGIFTTDDNALSFCQAWVIHLKQFYRGHLISPSVGCYVQDDDYSNPENFKCSYQCDESVGGKSLLIGGIEGMFSEYFKDDMSDDDYENIRSFICGGNAHRMFAGDHLEAASAADPSFWPIHPTVERMLQAKYMVGGFTNNSWPKVAQDGNDVCVFTECYDQYTSEYGQWKSCCDGHYEDSQLFNFIKADRNSYIGITNREALDLTNPTSETYGMPYIYDNFEYSHCKDTGYDIDDLLAQYALNSSISR